MSTLHILNKFKCIGTSAGVWTLTRNARRLWSIPPKNNANPNQRTDLTLLKTTDDALQHYSSEKYNSKNPLFARVTVNKEIHKGGNSIYRHIEFDIKGSGLNYEAGDHLGFFPVNDMDAVILISKLVKGDLKRKFSSKYNPEANLAAKCTFPESCTVCHALTFYLDITSPPPRPLLKQLAKYAEDENETSKLEFLASTKEDAIQHYRKNIIRKHKTIIDILMEFESINIDIVKLCELLPMLKTRYYSISCSPKKYPNTVSITLEIVKRGLASNWLVTKQPSEYKIPCVPIFVQKSSFRVPKNSRRPMVMICGGAGIAPFRSFIQERHAQFLQDYKLGKTTLFFGCRKRFHDFLYEKEFKKYVKEGLLTMYTAFPGDDSKTLSDIIQLHSQVIWLTIYNCGHVYVCGSRALGEMAVDHVVKIIQKNMMLTCAGAWSYFNKLKIDKRFQMEVA